MRQDDYILCMMQKKKRKKRKKERKKEEKEKRKERRNCSGKVKVKIAKCKYFCFIITIMQD